MVALVPPGSSACAHIVSPSTSNNTKQYQCLSTQLSRRSQAEIDLDPCCIFDINSGHTQLLKMNFRQRMGWLMVILFLSLSALIIYYMFEISETYNGLMLEHVQSYASSLKNNPGGITWRQTITNKLVSLPFWLWMVILLVPYLQVFCLLIACTKNDPVTASIALAPVCLVLRLFTCTSNGNQKNQYGLDVPVHT